MQCTVLSEMNRSMWFGCAIKAKLGRYEIKIQESQSCFFLSTFTITGMVVKKLCRVCGVHSERRCARCKWAWYCTKEHMVVVDFLRRIGNESQLMSCEQDWKQHKQNCKDPSTVPADENHIFVDAILFPVNGGRPLLVPFPIEVYEETDGEYAEVEAYRNLKQHRRDFRPWFTEGRVGSITTQCLGINGPLLGRTLEIRINDNFLNDGSALNRSILDVVCPTTHHWADNVIVFRKQEPELIYNVCLDATMEDLEPAKVYLSEYGRVREYFGAALIYTD